LFSAGSGGGAIVASPTPDRSATCAALGLMLTVLAGDDATESAGSPTTAPANTSTPPRDQRLYQASMRATQWLVRQQSANGAWLATYNPAGGDDVGSSIGQRVVRFDTRDFRDSTLALLMSADVLSNADAGRGANKAIALLLSMRLTQFKPPLDSTWATIYTGDGQPRRDITEFPLACDVLSTRNAMQTLMAASVFTGDVPTLDALTKAGQSLQVLRRPDGDWSRLIQPTAVPIGAKGAGVSPAPIGRPDIVGIELAVPPDVAILVGLTEELRTSGLTKFKADHNLFKSTARREMASAMTGLTDGAFSPMPQTIADAAVGPDAGGPTLAFRLERIIELLREIESGSNPTGFH
jgi:hypothetical protein